MVINMPAAEPARTLDVRRKVRPECDALALADEQPQRADHLCRGQRPGVAWRVGGMLGADSISVALLAAGTDAAGDRLRSATVAAYGRDDLIA